jgi:hypothetical protein
VEHTWRRCSGTPFFGLVLQVGPLDEPEGPELKILTDDDWPARIGAGLIPLRRFCCYH